MSHPVVFKNALVIDGTGALPQPVPTVIVAEGTIQEIAGPKANAPRGAQVVEFSVRTGKSQPGRRPVPGKVEGASIFWLRNEERRPWVVLASLSPPCAVTPHGSVVRILA